MPGDRRLHRLHTNGRVAASRPGWWPPCGPAVYVTKGLCAVTSALRAQGVQISAEVNRQITLNLFTTITNANFDKDAITQRVQATLLRKRELLGQVRDAASLPGGPPAGTARGDHVHGQGGCALHRK